MSVITEYFQAIKSINGGNLPTMLAFLEKHGVFCNSQPRPSKYKKLPNKQCFKNAYKMAERYPKDLIYVEGMSVYVVPVEHAWLIDYDGNVVDPTGDIPGTDYLGIPMKLSFVRVAILTRGYYGVFDEVGKSPIYKTPPPDFLQSVAIRKKS
jgi:hypothetical protein